MKRRLRPLHWAMGLGLAMAAIGVTGTRAQQTTAAKPAAPPLPANVVKAEFDKSEVYPGTWREYLGLRAEAARSIEAGAR